VATLIRTFSTLFSARSLIPSCPRHSFPPTSCFLLLCMLALMLRTSHLSSSLFSSLSPDSCLSAHILLFLLSSSFSLHARAHAWAHILLFLLFSSSLRMLALVPGCSHPSLPLVFFLLSARRGCGIVASIVGCDAAAAERLLLQSIYGAQWEQHTADAVRSRLVSLSLSSLSLSLVYVCMSVCMYVCMYVCI
jgi:hypothetical protein